MLCNEKYMHCGVFTIYLMANIGLLSFAMLDGVRPSRISQGTLHSTTSSTRIILPGESFPATVAGEVSIVSFNILAPSYHWLGVEESEKDIKMQQDREHRIPSAINLAKQANADVLCLQEVEGGSMEQEQELKDILVQSSPDFLGYDSYLWTPLHPNRKGDLVGLCVAWRSKRHNVSKFTRN
jgi:mRNA deadenylase 3'-5' endonuclease subunit Ccr4